MGGGGHRYGNILSLSGLSKSCPVTFCMFQPCLIIFTSIIISSVVELHLHISAMLDHIHEYYCYKSCSVMSCMFHLCIVAVTGIIIVVSKLNRLFQ